MRRRRHSGSSSIISINKRTLLILYVCIESLIIEEWKTTLRIEDLNFFDKIIFEKIMKELIQISLDIFISNKVVSFLSLFFFYYNIFIEY